MSDPLHPSGARSYNHDSEAIESFRVVMMSKLRANAHKDSWMSDAVDVLWLLDRLTDELDELRDAVHEWHGGGSADHVMGECADVANFAMMIHHRVAGGMS